MQLVTDVTSIPNGSTESALLARYPMGGDKLKVIRLAMAASLAANGVVVDADNILITKIFYHVIDGGSTPAPTTPAGSTPTTPSTTPSSRRLLVS